ncbi:hypothetical protein H1S01_10725 [Heliobacterium chlorum]|uniref:ASCH domain-containing protein n=1 Tax=Heliobacterium chlorum TaxID=2698 RepID=A0ABR7T2I6_HELCL|nr:hypothetical protein [Heliobacterium chlorum]MBC9784982.1 hypothetical protein [Heliobacterium chlorum]
MGEMVVVKDKSLIKNTIIREEEFLNAFSIESYHSGNEIYIPFSKLNKFVAFCLDNSVLIASVELFKVINGRVIPYAELIAIDSYRLFDENVEWTSNVNKCNRFILDCYKRIGDRVKDLYFNPVILLEVRK